MDMIRRECECVEEVEVKKAKDEGTVKVELYSDRRHNNSFNYAKFTRHSISAVPLFNFVPTLRIIIEASSLMQLSVTTVR